MPESPLWLISKNRYIEAGSILKKIAVSNNKSTLVLTYTNSKLNLNKDNNSGFSFCKTIKILKSSPKFLISVIVFMINL